MKKLKYVLLLSLVLITGVSFSQSKTSHINYSQLVLSMPETTAAKTELDNLTKSYQAQLTKIETEYKTKLEAFQKEEKTLAPAIKELRLKELKDLEASFKNFQEAANKEIKEKYNALFNPIFEKAKTAVTEVAKSKGYSYVIDSSKDQYVYMNPKDDLMELVKKKMVLK